MIALPHGLVYDTEATDNSPQTRFRVIDKGQGQVILQCEDGRYVFVSVYGMIALIDNKKDWWQYLIFFSIE